MNSEEECIEVFQNEYYRVVYFLSNIEKGKKWLCKVRITRKDTGEYLKGGCTILEESKEAALKSANKKSDLLAKELNERGRPDEWETDVRRILYECKKLRSGVSKFGARCSELISSEPNDDAFWEIYPEFWMKLIRESATISQKISALEPAHRLQLLTSPSEVFVDPSDQWSLEDLDSRILAFQLFLDPTEDEVEAAENQKRRLAQRFEELGWG